MVVRCNYTGGGTVSALSDDGGASGGANCENQCGSDEFGAYCGGLPRELPDGGFFEPSSSAPFSSCRSLGATPGGTAFYCCRCDST